MLLASIEPDSALESTAAALRKKHIEDFTWEYVATTLIDEYNARCTAAPDKKDAKRGRSRRKVKKKSNASDQRSSRADSKSDSEDYSDTQKTARVLAAALKLCALAKAMIRDATDAAAAGRNVTSKIIATLIQTIPIIGYQLRFSNR